MEREDIVAALIWAADGQRITGKVRLQKLFYLLEQIDRPGGFEYEYHYYGPYSAQLTLAAENAKALGLVVEDPAFRASDGMPYSVFKANSAKISNEIKTYVSQKGNKLLDLLKKTSDSNSTVLELAATIHWLIYREGMVKDWLKELKVRKGAKAQEPRLTKAIELLKDIGLPVT